MRLIMSRLKGRLAADEGFSMVLVVMVMIATGMFVAAGFAAANGDLPISRDSQDRKAAYAAAESGINFYQFHLNADNDYWLRCDNVPAPNATEKNPVNKFKNWNGVGTDPRRWRKVAGSDAEYTIELLPAAGKSECVEGDASSMQDPVTQTFRIRVTGRPHPKSKLRRTINATFKRKGFLDFLYFTHRETRDPAAYPSSGTRDDDWAAANCTVSRTKRHNDCVEIQFPSNDELKGPLHSNDDSIYVCGTPTFGRNAGDKLSVSGKVAPGWKQNPEGTGCTGSPNLNGPFAVGVAEMTMPPTNSTLKAVAQSGGILYTGTTIIEFQSTGGMKVTNAALGWTRKQVALPANGVIYVQKGTGCTTTVPPTQANYSEAAGCAKLYVSGEYTGDLTLVSADDIIVKPNVAATGTALPDAMLKPNGDYVMGLIAENYVRVYHRTNPSDCSKNVEAMNIATIHAAILSLQHSFIVDNYGCGQPLGDLNVKGAIAQRYRGPVGTGNATTNSTGYLKNYEYDDRLRYRTPPFFLDPVKVTWKVLKTNEQVPPAK